MSVRVQPKATPIVPQIKQPQVYRAPAGNPPKADGFHAGGVRQQPLNDPNNPYLDLVGLKKGSTDKARVQVLQQRLVELGLLKQSDLAGASGVFGPKTEAALKEFQRSQNLPQTGVVDAATAAALGDPRSPVDGRLGTVPAAHAAALGRPVGPAQTLPDGTVRQTFDRGYVEKLPDGSVHVSAPSSLLDRTYVPGQALADAQAAGIAVNQRDGDSAAGNNNCGFASSVMAMKALGLRLPTPDPTMKGDTADYRVALKMRELGAPGTTVSDPASPNEIVKALNAAGAHASKIENTWGSNKLAAVDLMRQRFMDPSQREAFIVAGNPALGWPDHSDYNGSHFVAVVGYDPVKDVFIVCDPYPPKGQPAQPIEVTPQQLANYMTDTGAEAGELIEVTPPPPPPVRPGRYQPV